MSIPILLSTYSDLTILAALSGHRLLSGPAGIYMILCVNAKASIWQKTLLYNKWLGINRGTSQSYTQPTIITMFWCLNGCYYIICIWVCQVGVKLESVQQINLEFFWVTTTWWCLSIGRHKRWFTSGRHRPVSVQQINLEFFWVTTTWWCLSIGRHKRWLTSALAPSKTQHDEVNLMTKA